MKYLVTFNVLDRRSGRPTPLKVSCEFKDLSRAAAISAFLQYASHQGILIGGVPSSVEAVGPLYRPRKTAKVKTPSL